MLKKPLRFLLQYKSGVLLLGSFNYWRHDLGFTEEHSTSAISKTDVAGWALTFILRYFIKKVDIIIYVSFAIFKVILNKYCNFWRHEVKYKRTENLSLEELKCRVPELVSIQFLQISRMKSCFISGIIICLC